MTWRRWLAIAVLAVLGLVVGLVIALKRHPVYSSTGTVSSARVNVLAEALPGYVTAATSLASTYSRIATSDAVETRVAKKLHVPVSQVQGNLSATPIPQDPVLSIVGKGSSPAAAQRLTSTAASELVSYVTGLATSPAASRQLLAQYKVYSAQIQRLGSQIGSLKATGGSKKKIRALEQQQNEANLHVKAISSAYVNASQALTSGATAQVLTAAGPAKSDKKSKVEDYGLIGLVVGLVIGGIGAVATRPRTRSRSAVAMARV